MQILATIVIRIFLLVSGTMKGEEAAMPCVITRHPPFVTALLEEKVQVLGCNSWKLTQKSQEVHILSLENAGPNQTAKWLDYLPSVTVLIKPRLEHSTHAGPLVVVLHSRRPVMWHLQVDRVDRSSRMVIVITNGSELAMTTLWKPVINNRSTTSLNKLLSWVKNHRFGAITSFSHVRLANKIILRVGTAQDDDDYCETSSLRKASQTVDAFYQHPVPTSGCLLHQTLLNKRDIHVVELVSPGSGSEVTVHIEGPSEEQYISDAQKNMMLVLKSHSSTSWRVESRGIDGTISVVAETEVVAASVPPYLNLQAWPQKLPGGGVELIDWVTKEYGPIATYTTTDVANRIVILSSRKEQTGQEMQNDEQLAVTEQPNRQSFPLSKLSGNVLVLNDQMPDKGVLAKRLRDIAREMLSRCTDEGVHIAFPRENVLSVLELTSDELAITLKDLECQANMNGTHYVLDYSLIGCGARQKQRPSGNAYSNQVLFWKYKSSNQDTSLESDNVTQTQLLLSLNYLCDFNVTYDGIQALEEVLQPNFFKLQIFKSKNFSDVIHSFPIAIFERSYVFVEASIDSGPEMCVTIEDCWLSDSVMGNSWKTSLIKSSCPNDLSVQFLNVNGRLNCKQRFSFQLSGEEFSTRKTFLYCRLAACTNDTIKAIHKCLDPEEFCLNHSLRSFLDTSSYKHSSLEVQGPFTVMYKKKGDEAESTTKVSNNLEGVKPSRPHVVLVVGLPMEVVVGIAFASFIIGAGLTAILWFIHQKTDPLRNKRTHSRKKKVEQNCDCDPSAHSGSSTPSSQAPMTVHA